MKTLATATATLARTRDKATSTLTILAIALPHSIMLAVIGGVLMFHTRSTAPTNDIMADSIHLTLACFAATMLIIPALSMGAAAARLGLSRKSRTLATLRLLGITPATARTASALDTLAHSAIGIIIGTALYTATLPAWTLLTFQDTPITATELWIGPLPILTAGILMLALTALSSISAMQRVAITPLGVIRNSNPSRINLPALICVAVIMVLWLAIAPLIGQFGTMIAMTVTLGFMAAMIALINVIGVAAVKLLGHLTARTARTATRILAGRRLINDPHAVWRSFGALGLVAFLVGLLLPIISAIGMSGQTADLDEYGRILIADIRTGLLLTLGISIALAAISTAVQQAIRAIDSAAQRQALARMGAPKTYWTRARRLEVAYPACVIIGGAVLTGLLFISPLAASSNLSVPIVGVLISTVVAVLIVLIAAESARLLEH